LANFPNVCNKDIPVILGYNYQSFSSLERAISSPSELHSVIKSRSRMGYHWKAKPFTRALKGIIFEALRGAIQSRKTGQPMCYYATDKTIAVTQKWLCDASRRRAFLAQQKADIIQFTAIYGGSSRAKNFTCKWRVLLQWR